MTVGKIYGGLLILESWRTTKFGQVETCTNLVVSRTLCTLCGPTNVMILSVHGEVLGKADSPFVLVVVYVVSDCEAWTWTVHLSLSLSFSFSLSCK